MKDDVDPHHWSNLKDYYCTRCGFEMQSFPDQPLLCGPCTNTWYTQNFGLVEKV